MSDEKKPSGKEEGEQVVTPWEAKAGEGQASIDYDKLISKFQKCWDLVL